MIHIRLIRRDFLPGIGSDSKLCTRIIILQKTNKILRTCVEATQSSTETIPKTRTAFRTRWQFAR